MAGSNAWTSKDSPELQVNSSGVAAINGFTTTNGRSTRGRTGLPSPARNVNLSLTSNKRKHDEALPDQSKPRLPSNHPTFKRSRITSSKVTDKTRSTNTRAAKTSAERRGEKQYDTRPPALPPLASPQDDISQQPAPTRPVQRQNLPQKIQFRSLGDYDLNDKYSTIVSSWMIGNKEFEVRIAIELERTNVNDPCYHNHACRLAMLKEIQVKHNRDINRVVSDSASQSDQEDKEDEEDMENPYTWWQG